jgi:drug/metabolite transporter (DMT)-like permease
MGLAVVLSLAASFCTATSSVCQRLGARSLEAQGHQVKGFDIWLVFRLARQPAWLLGFASMLTGFALQVSALRFGPLALVQPILAMELLFVFGYLAVLHRRGVRWREWLAAAAMSAGISVFLRAASPSGGRANAPASLWWPAGLGTLGFVLAAIAVAWWQQRKKTVPRQVAATRRAAILGVATGVGWGFVAAVIKELSSRLGDGPGAIFSNWSPYVLMVVGAATMILASHAMAAGPLAASQPGFTICDPSAAVLIGVFLFGERLQTRPADLAAELAGLVVVAIGVATLSHSRLITGQDAGPPPGADHARDAGTGQEVTVT